MAVMGCVRFGGDVVLCGEVVCAWGMEGARLRLAPPTSVKSGSECVCRTAWPHMAVERGVVCDGALPAPPLTRR